MLTLLMACITVTPEVQGICLTGISYRMTLPLGRRATLQAGLHRRVEHRVPCSPDAAEVAITVGF